MQLMEHEGIDVFMRQAAREAEQGAAAGEGGPFGALIVQGSEVVAVSHNEVIKTKDPTAHAEILAIRAASRKLGRFDLSDCALVSSCEPCPMCLAAVYWAGIRKLYYGCTRRDAADAGFQDDFLYEVLAGRADASRLAAEQIGREACLTAFEIWRNKEDKIKY
jgi:guanine deaminase